VERTPACREAFQVEYTPDPRQPGVRLQKPPSELPVTATATADEQGVTRFVFDTFDPFGRRRDDRRPPAPADLAARASDSAPTLGP
jgi:hypothetical protein